MVLVPELVRNKKSYIIPVLFKLLGFSSGPEVIGSASLLIVGRVMVSVELLIRINLAACSSGLI